jgi:hypothetical protein
MRICYACGSDKTSIYGKYHKKKWYLNNDNDRNMFCSKCYLKYISNPKWRLINDQNRFRFKDKRYILNDNPRLGICQWCGKVKDETCKRTSIHHEKYNDLDPLDYTVELCNSCHQKRTWELNQITNAGKWIRLKYAQ